MFFPPSPSPTTPTRVAITGAGILDGQAGPGRWWHWAGPWEGARATGWTPGRPPPIGARPPSWPSRSSPTIPLAVIRGTRWHATLARLGFVVFQYDMVGVGDSTALPHAAGVLICALMNG